MSAAARSFPSILHLAEGFFYRHEYNINGIFVYASDGARQVTGYDPSELECGNFYYSRLINTREYPEILSRRFADLEKHMRSESEFTLVNKEGNSVRVSEKAIVVVEAGTCYIDGYIQKTSRNKAENLLVKSPVFFQKAINQSSVVSITDVNGDIIYANELFCSFSEFSPEELVGRNHRIMNSGYHSNSFFKDMWSTIHSGQIWRGEIRNLSKSGKYYWMDTVISPVMDNNEIITGFISISNLVNERKEIENALRESEELNNSVLDALTSRIAVIDRYGKILKANKAWREYSDTMDCSVNLHCAPEDNYLDHLMDKQHEGIEISNAIEGIMAVLSKKEFSFQMEYRCDNHQKWFLMSARGYGKDTVKVVLRFVDITSSKNTELQLTRLVNELTNRNNEHMQFNYIVSHNLRGPIAQLIGLCSIISFPNIQDHEKERTIQYIKKSALKMDDLVKDLSGILSSRSTVHQVKENVSFDLMLESILDSLYIQIKDTHAEIKVQMEKDARGMYTVKHYLESIIYNLVSNAIKYRSQNRSPKIRLSFKREEEFMVITVTDNGVGIDLERHAKKVFGLYHRFHEHIEGKGLGLYMTKTQVESLGGSISIKSRPEEGTEITVRIPYADLVTS
jgi:PAS domain S-box-containing protein